MNSKENEQLAAIQDMRDMMEKSTKFLSLSGLAGILVGTMAMIAGAIVYRVLDMPITHVNYLEYIMPFDDYGHSKQIQYLILDAVIVFVLAFIIGAIFAKKNAAKRGLSIWDATSRRLLYNMFLPVLFGAVFIFSLMYHRQLQFILPVMLTFYGLALFNASKYAFDEIRILGLLDILLGLVASFWIEGGLILWMIGFGILHIVYGSIIYSKYEK